MALLTPLMLQEQTLAQVLTFEFRSEVSRNQLESHCSKGYLSIKNVSIPDQDMVRLQAVMQDFPQGLLGSGEGKTYFIVDSGALQTSTFNSKDCVPSSLNCFRGPQC